MERAAIEQAIEQAEVQTIARDRVHFLLLNIGHYLDHLFTLIFATVAALALTREWGLGYADLLTYATPGFFAFGLFSLPAGWLADKWSREGMISVFFVGIGIASIVTGYTRTPLELGFGLFAIGVMAAIYHPVGLAIVVAKWKNTGMRLAVNGVWGNFGVASAALITGYFIDHGGWRLAFIVPGVVSILVGIVHTWARWPEIIAGEGTKGGTAAVATGPMAPDLKALLLRVSVIVFVTTAVSSLIFQSMSFALPKIFAERLGGVAAQLSGWLTAVGVPGKADVATVIGGFAFMVFAVASMAQLIVGSLLDRYGPRPVFMVAASVQLLFFALMPGKQEAWALAIAMGFMFGAFGQIPINDFMIAKMASGPARARIYGVRYVVSFSVLAAALPLIALIHARWGFDTLFVILAIAAAVILGAASLLPRKLPSAG
jgi:MFS family permease